jgi:hypothetical protein
LKHFLADEWKKVHRIMRGGHQPHLALESQSAEDRYRLEAIDRMDAESLYERRWAITLLERVLERLREHAVAAGDRRGDASPVRRDFHVTFQRFCRCMIVNRQTGLTQHRRLVLAWHLVDDAPNI